MKTNYKQLEHLLLKYSFEKLKVSKEPEKLLDILKKNNPSMIENAQKLELLAAAIVYVHLKRNSLNGRGGITAKDVGAYFSVKASAITGKVFDVEFWIDHNKKALFADEPYEYIDIDRFEVNEEYWEFLESLEADDIEEGIKVLKKIIQKDPDYYDPYITLHEYYIADGKGKKAFDILSQGYRRAKKLVMAEDRFPDKLLWLFLENRHILRVMFNYAVIMWSTDSKAEALSIFQQLLKSDTNDNIGARYAIIALLEGYESYEHFEEQFTTESGYLNAGALNEWFYEKSQKHERVIGWWLVLEEENIL